LKVIKQKKEEKLKVEEDVRLMEEYVNENEKQGEKAYKKVSVTLKRLSKEELNDLIKVRNQKKL
jgi:hypothetical protein